MMVEDADSFDYAPLDPDNSKQASGCLVVSVSYDILSFLFD
jgi:hypothetical protein